MSNGIAYITWGYCDINMITKEGRDEIAEFDETVPPVAGPTAACETSGFLSLPWGQQSNRGARH